jgi:hypothetical protein
MKYKFISISFPGVDEIHSILHTLNVLNVILCGDIEVGAWETNITNVSRKQSAEQND